MFDLIRSWRRDHAVHCAFDLLEFDGQDLRRLPIEERKGRLARALPKPSPGITLNEYFAGDGELTLARAAFAVEEKPAGRFMVRNRTRVVQRHLQGDCDSASGAIKRPLYEARLSGTW